jgi:ribosomal protein S18 acetylase RimI-like enzyme
MTESDRDLYIEMAEEFYHSDAVLHPIPRAHFEKTAEEALKSGTYAEIYLLEYEGKTAGYGLTARTFSQEAGGQVLWIEELYIREAFRSRGLGREFFSYLEENNKGVLSRLRLEVEADNTRAISLYERLGYEVLDYVQMIKDFE